MNSIAIAEDIELDLEIIINSIKKIRKKQNIAWHSKNGLDFTRRYQEQDYKPHLLIIDYKMPYKNGIQVMKEIKEINPSQKIILCSHSCPPQKELRELHEFENTWFSPKDQEYLHQFITCAIEGKAHKRQQIIEENWRLRSIRDKLETHDELEIFKDISALDIKALKMCSNNLTNSERAHILGLTYSRFNAIKGEIKSRLGILNDSEIILFLLRYHLIEIS